MKKDAALPKAGGQALKQAIHVARARAGITSDMQLSLRSGVHYDTFMNWFGERTVPRGAELKKVATALGVPLSELEYAYEGRDPEPPPLQDAIRELVEEMRLSRAQQDEATVALLRALGAIVSGVPERQGTPNGTGDGEPAGTRRG